MSAQSAHVRPQNEVDAARGGAVEPDTLRLVNQLGGSRSPYVRGHMNNPVAWQMWTPEALELAKRTDRLLFVSIGYSACHWCHVMERESFENAEVARLLNDSFVPIKVDREERPDIDRIQMNYVQATTGAGGWPLNVFLTPDLEPLFGGTYWPGPGSATQLPGHPGLVEILRKMRDVWMNQRSRCLESAKEITVQLREFAQEGLISKQDSSREAPGDALDLELLEEAYAHFAAKYDPNFAGFGIAPKFPTPVNLAFLLRLGQGPQEVIDVVGDSECKEAKKMVLETLRSMWKGGIKDQIGNGFARYSVTRDWSLPHFEKMLYDQAQLLSVYLDAYLLTDDPEFRDATHDIAAYLTSEPMAAPGGGFYSSEDADSYSRPTDKVKREGAFYVWTRKELQSILRERDAEVFCRYYGVQDNGNVDPDHDTHDELIDQNVLAVTCTSGDLAKDFGLSEEEVEQILNQGRQELLDRRRKERPRPGLDDKILVSWNGLAISALARLSGAVEDSEPEKSRVYLDYAQKAAEFVRARLYDESTATLKRVYREGPGDTSGFADDYAFLITGLIDLYEATFDDAWLEWADNLQRKQIELFHDDEGGGFFSTSEHQPDLIMRLKDGMDNAEPSTNGTTATNLTRLASLLGDEEYAALAKGTVHAFEAETMQHPFLFPSLLNCVVSGRLGMKGVVFTGDSDEINNAIRKSRRSVNSFRTVIKIGGIAKSSWLSSRNKLLRSLDSTAATVQVCENNTCRLLDDKDVAMALN